MRRHVLTVGSFVLAAIPILFIGICFAKWAGRPTPPPPPVATQWGDQTAWTDLGGGLELKFVRCYDRQIAIFRGGGGRITAVDVGPAVPIPENIVLTNCVFATNPNGSAVIISTRPVVISK